MTEKELENARSRTDAKLRYAKVHLDELMEAGSGGSDFERSHMESYLFHLFGARDAFLGELKQYYELDPGTEVRLGAIRDALVKSSKPTTEVAVLHQLEQSNAGWYRTMKDLRDHSTHIGSPRHHFHLNLGSEQPNLVEIEHPQNGQRIDRTSIANWLTEMSNLLAGLRSSALSFGLEDFSQNIQQS